MKKVICPDCGLVNLEKFVTFPNCAGCGIRLPVIVQEPLFERWKRPLRAPLWATFVGLCCAGLGFWAITIARETGQIEEQRLMAYVEFPRNTETNQTSTIQIVLDTTEADDSTTVPQFTGVRLRVAKSTSDDFKIISVSPAGTLTKEGSGQYIIFSTIARDQQITLYVLPRHAGKGRIALSVFVQDFSPFHYQGTMKIARAKMAPTAKSQQPLKLVH